MGSKIGLWTNNYTQVFTECCGRKEKLDLRRSGDAFEEVTSELNLEGKIMFEKQIENGLRCRMGS